MTTRTLWLLGGLAATSLLVGCASKVDLKAGAAQAMPAATPTAAAAKSGDAASAFARPAAESTVASVDLSRQVASAAAPEPGRFIYFDFDSFGIAPEFKPVVEGHARRMAADGGKRLQVEGHADERGGREYNLALGQRRAEAVVRSLVLLGADRERLEAISFGEERPKAQGSDEAAWALNRRAELSSTRR
jgi:peptidoglycan-associated lipoprotein